MIFSRMHLKILINIYNNKFILKYNTTPKILKLFLTQNLRDISTFCENNVFEEQLKEVFKFKNSNVSNWIIENKARTLCNAYQESNKKDKEQILRILAFRYAVEHTVVCNVAEKYVSTESDNKRRMISYERNLRNVLTPNYQWLFIMIGRLENGVKFLVDLRTDILELILKIKDTDESIAIQQLNITLRDLLLLWFSVGFLYLERITWQTSCDILQKISDYEAIHPIKNWLDLKQRVGPYRRCYIFTHLSMPREPLVVLHTALCDIIPDSVKDIDEAKVRILGNLKKEITFLEEDKNKIKTAIFYSITSTQKGLQGIELGNYLIKEVAKEVISEFPMIHELSSLSPIPNFRTWFLEKIKQDICNIFTNEECNSIQEILKEKDITFGLKKILNNSLWTQDIKICEVLKKPLLRACAWYLYKEKRRNYALDSVANFHLRNGAVMWRINWLADPSPRGVGNSCGIMVNYRYYLHECEKHSQTYIENYFINASEDIINLSTQYKKL
ncbi:malonyl-CoA decarboxylase, mitochondrial [Apis cerana]|uniref:Malonyl-CoA decarboxylase n=1 Tax=Apis cerana cerana TaxID=94128 RepID=A0A2A3E0X6_APICC|nr:malonyl-CoA decarboxylase, mitochondrial [Apis cerana]XP_061937532.1 malonyl-CoA decarboxylase, mitochondrial [Apis cerana]PBC25423.1 Malonyl-CoA decarboxylase [Apis cerana cerana]